jgi:hypothetical protein
MNIDTITFDSANDCIIVTLDNGLVTEYTKADVVAYLAQFPDRVADLVAMGWQQKEQL